jgi:hypothetical protein
MGRTALTDPALAAARMRVACVGVLEHALRLLPIGSAEVRSKPAARSGRSDQANSDFARVTLLIHSLANNVLINCYIKTKLQIFEIVGLRDGIPDCS